MHRSYRENKTLFINSYKYKWVILHILELIKKMYVPITCFKSHLKVFFFDKYKQDIFRHTEKDLKNTIYILGTRVRLIFDKIKKLLLFLL